MQCENCNNGPAKVVTVKLNNENICLCDRCANDSGTRYPFEIERCKISIPGLHPVPAFCYTEEGEKSRIALQLGLPDNFVPRAILKSEDTMPANEKAFKRVATVHYEQRLRAAYLKSGNNDFISGREIDDIVDYGFLAGKKQITIARALKTALPEHRHNEVDKAIRLSPQNNSKTA